ncbi:MAG: hypothetical protein AAGB34_07960, partial [Planctomycetota bacterium]
LLIGILLPALSGVRRQARITLCVNNQKQHAIGIQNYAASNNDQLVNAPRSTGAAALGPRGIPAYSFAGVNNELSGFGISGSASSVGNATSDFGIPTIDAPLGAVSVIPNGTDGPDQMENATIYNTYWIPLGPFMVDGNGMQMMQEIFITPSDPGDIIDSWTVAKQTFLGSSGSDGFNPTDVATVEGGGAIGFFSGSYRYVPAAYTNSSIWKYLSDGTTQLATTLPNGQPNMTSTWDLATWQAYGKAHGLASVGYPSKKALFFLQDAAHNPSVESWLGRGATTTLAMADGSAGQAVALTDSLQPDSRDNAGGWYGPGVSITIDGDPVDMTENGNGLPFLTTMGGIEGRDL